MTIFNLNVLLSFDGETYITSNIEESKHDHSNTFGLAIYKNKILTTGGAIKAPNVETKSNKTELLDMETYKWSDAADFPAM